MEKIVVKETYRSSKPQKENKVEEKKKSHVDMIAYTMMMEKGILSKGRYEETM